MAEQLSFDLPVRTALGRADFYVAQSNRVALSLVENSALWPSGKLILSGAQGAGKTHLAHVWATQSGAQIVSASALDLEEVPRLASGPLVIEDVPAIAQNTPMQEALFHVHNLCLAGGHPLLMTGRGAPKSWAMALPDLQSRIDGTQAALIDPPDDELLSVILAKLFADRQITPKPSVIPYMIKRMDRSFAAAQSAVARLDTASLGAGRGLTRDFVAQLLGDLDNQA